MARGLVRVAVCRQLLQAVRWKAFALAMQVDVLRHSLVATVVSSFMCGSLRRLLLATGSSRCGGFAAWHYASYTPHNTVCYTILYDSDITDL